MQNLESSHIDTAVVQKTSGSFFRQLGAGITLGAAAILHGAAGDVPVAVAQDKKTEDKKEKVDPSQELASALLNAYSKGGDVPGIYKKLEEKGVGGAVALLRYRAHVGRLDFRIATGDWLIQRAKDDPGIAQALIDHLDSPRFGADAEELLPKVGAPVADQLMKRYLHGPGPGGDAKLMRMRTKNVLALLPSECSVPRLTLLMADYAKGTGPAMPDTGIPADTAYLLCLRLDGVKKLTEITTKHGNERTVRAVVKGATMVLDEAGNDLLPLGKSGEEHIAAWQALFDAVRLDAEGRKIVEPAETKFGAIVEHRKKTIEEFYKKKGLEKKTGWLQPLSPRQFSYATIMDSREKTRRDVAMPFSDRRSRSETSEARKMASLRASSESARQRMAS